MKNLKIRSTFMKYGQNDHPMCWFFCSSIMFIGGKLWFFINAKVWIYIDACFCFIPYNLKLKSHRVKGLSNTRTLDTRALLHSRVIQTSKLTAQSINIKDSYLSKLKNSTLMIVDLKSRWRGLLKNFISSDILIAVCHFANFLCASFNRFCL